MDYLEKLHQSLIDRLAQPTPLVLPGVANPLAARIAEDAGFEAVYLTGAGLSNTRLGVPDIGLSTLTDVTDTLFAMRDVISLPIVVDADTGFGNAVNVYHAVRWLEAAGASAIQLEDQVSPKRCGHFDGQTVITREEMIGKIKAATDARRDGRVRIVARTDARASEGFSQALDRAVSYAEAGADVIFVEALASEAEMRECLANISLPQVINIVHGGKTPELSFDKIQDIGFSVALYANAALQASLAAMQTVFRSLAETGSLHDVSSLLAPFEERQKIVRRAMFQELEERFTNFEAAPKR